MKKLKTKTKMLRTNGQ